MYFGCDVRYLNRVEMIARLFACAITAVTVFGFASIDTLLSALDSSSVRHLLVALCLCGKCLSTSLRMDHRTSNAVLSLRRCNARLDYLRSFASQKFLSQNPPCSLSEAHELWDQASEYWRPPKQRPQRHHQQGCLLGCADKAGVLAQQ